MLIPIVATVGIGLLLIRLFFKKLFPSSYTDSKGLAVFISGCDSGIGRFLAEYFDEIGCEVFAGCLDAVKSRTELPEKVHVVPLDITNHESVCAAVATVQNVLAKEAKDLWALINNAGICIYGEFEWQTWNQCQKQVEVNLLGTMRMTKAFIPLLRKMKGRLITVTSVNGSIAYPGISVYSATKFALEGLNNALRLELRRHHGIKVIIVQPGDHARLTSIMSQHERNAQEMWDAMSEDTKRHYGEFFHMYQRVTLKNIGLTSPSTLKNSPLINDMRDAVLLKNPKERYISANFQYIFIYRLMSVLPTCFVDGILDFLTNLLYRSDKKVEVSK